MGVLRFAVSRVLLSGNLVRTSNTRRSVLVRHTTCAGRRVMDEVLAEEKVQSPLQGDADLLFQARQLTQVDRPPEEPGEEAREVQAEDVGNTGPLADRGQLPQHGIDERLLGAATNRRSQVSRQDFALSQGVLGRWRVKFGRSEVADRGA